MFRRKKTDPHAVLKRTAALIEEGDTVRAMIDGAEWVPCSPAWLDSMPPGACGTEPRRKDDSMIYSHLHPVPMSIEAQEHENNRLQELLALFVHAVGRQPTIPHGELRQIMHEADDNDFALFVDVCLKTGTMRRVTYGTETVYVPVRSTREAAQAAENPA